MTILSTEIESLRTEMWYQKHPLPGQEGYSWPNIDRPSVINIVGDTLEELSRRGITVEGVPRSGNRVICSQAGAAGTALRLRFGGNDNTIVLDQSARIQGSVAFEGDKHRLLVGAAGVNVVNVNLVFRTHSTAVFIGKDCTCGGLHTWLEGPGNSIIIGDDAMMSWGVWLRCADGHAIVDFDGNIINQPESVIVGPHVWIGHDVLVTKGSEIGAGSVVGARAVVVKRLPACVVAAGVPARVVREKVTWTRPASPNDHDVHAVLDRLGRYGVDHLPQ